MCGKNAGIRERGSPGRLSQQRCARHRENKTASPDPGEHSGSRKSRNNDADRRSGRRHRCSDEQGHSRPFQSQDGESYDERDLPRAVSVYRRLDRRDQKAQRGERHRGLCGTS